MVAALASAAALGALAIMRPTAPPELSPMQTSLLPPPDVTWNAWWPLSISPDGRHLVFVARAAGQEPRLWARSFDPSDSDARPLEGTERGNLPFWSADSRNIGFFVPGQLKRVPLRGGAVQMVSGLLGDGIAGTWNRDNVILFADRGVGLFKVPAAGGKPVQLTGPAEWPIFLPDGDRFLYCKRLRPDEQSGQGPFPAGPAASLGSPQGQRVTQVGSNVAFAPPGNLLFLQQRTLGGTAVRLGTDADTRRSQQPIASDVGRNNWGAIGSVFGVSHRRARLPHCSAARSRAGLAGPIGPQAERARATRPLFLAGAVTRREDGGIQSRRRADRDERHLAREPRAAAGSFENHLALRKKRRTRLVSGWHAHRVSVDQTDRLRLVCESRGHW